MTCQIDDHPVSPLLFWAQFYVALRGRYDAELLYESVRAGIKVTLGGVSYRLT